MTYGIILLYFLDLASIGISYSGQNTPGPKRFLVCNQKYKHSKGEKVHNFLLLYNIILASQNKLAKARKTRTSPSTLGLKKFGLG